MTRAEAAIALAEHLVARRQRNPPDGHPKLLLDYIDAAARESAGVVDADPVMANLEGQTLTGADVSLRHVQALVRNRLAYMQRELALRAKAASHHAQGQVAAYREVLELIKTELEK